MAAPPKRYQYWVVYTFPNLLYDREVEQVFVRTGILRGGDSGCSHPAYETPLYWDQIQQLPMKKKGDHFFVKSIFEISAEHCSSKILGPIAQYWVKFSNRSSLITNARMIPIAADSRSIETRFAQITDSTDAQAWSLVTTP